LFAPCFRCALAFGSVELFHFAANPGAYAPGYSLTTLRAYNAWPFKASIPRGLSNLTNESVMDEGWKSLVPTFRKGRERMVYSSDDLP
jgi:hypothetical protein